MEDQKKKDLEELKKQIDPEVLERVSKAMSGDDSGGGSAPAPSSSGGGGGTSVSSGPRSGGLGELKARIARREKELNLPSDPEIATPERKQGDDNSQSAKDNNVTPAPGGTKRTHHDKSFVVYDVNMLRGRQILAYMQRMKLTHVSVTGDPKRFLEALLNMLNDTEVIFPAILVHVDSYPIVNAILASDEIKRLKNKLRRFAEMAVFVLYENDRELSRAQEVDPRYLLNLRHDTEFNKKRIVQVLELLHAP